jgi:hypothetical protein
MLCPKLLLQKSVKNADLSRSPSLPRFSRPNRAEESGRFRCPFSPHVRSQGRFGKVLPSLRHLGRRNRRAAYGVSAGPAHCHHRPGSDCAILSTSTPEISPIHSVYGLAEHSASSSGEERPLTNLRASTTQGNIESPSYGAVSLLWGR